MASITSRANKEIVGLTRLLSDRKERRARGLFVAEGLRTVSLLIESGLRLQRLYLGESLPDQEIDRLRALCQSRGFDPKSVVVLVNKPVLEKISDTKSPSGIVGLFTIPVASNDLPLEEGVVLVDITVPGNMGTIIRTASALGKKNVVIIGGADVWSPKVIQASAGTIGLINIIECSWDELLVRKKATPLHALVVKGGESPNKEDKKALLVVGNEANGLSEAMINDCDKKITLPMPGKVESLNAALAVSIVMYVPYLVEFGKLK